MVSKGDEALECAPVTNKTNTALFLCSAQDSDWSFRKTIPVRRLFALSVSVLNLIRAIVHVSDQRANRAGRIDSTQGCPAKLSCKFPSIHMHSFCLEEASNSSLVTSKEKSPNKFLLRFLKLL